MKNLSQQKYCRQKRFRPAGSVLRAALLLVWLLSSIPASAPDRKTFVFYFSTHREVLPLRQIKGNRLLPLEDTLRLLGTVTERNEARGRLSLRLNRRQLIFRARRRRVRIGRERVRLSSNVIRNSEGWWIPLSFLDDVLPRLVAGPVVYSKGSPRCFVGMVTPNSFRLRFDPARDQARLTLQFLRPVVVQRLAAPGQWVFLLGNEPFNPPRERYDFESPLLKNLKFDDQDGIPKLILTPAPGDIHLSPSVVSKGSVLILDVRGTPEPVAGESPFPLTSTPQHPDPSLPTIVLDPGHGGPDFGVRSKDGVAEKDWTWRVADRVRLELLATGRYRVLLTRNQGEQRTLEQRQVKANTAPALLFLSFHAGDTGPASRTLTPHIFQAPFRDVKLPRRDKLSLIPWNEVQEHRLSGSLRLALMLQKEFSEIRGFHTRQPLRTPVRLLEGINAPAVVIEAGNFSSGEDGAWLRNRTVIRQISQAVVRATENFSP